VRCCQAVVVAARDVTAMEALRAAVTAVSVLVVGAGLLEPTLAGESRSGGVTKEAMLCERPARP
jgi:hypothetical protein